MSFDDWLEQTIEEGTSATCQDPFPDPFHAICEREEQLITEHGVNLNNRAV